LRLCVALCRCKRPSKSFDIALTIPLKPYIPSPICSQENNIILPDFRQN
jgi:hypothetical protein